MPRKKKEIKTTENPVSPVIPKEETKKEIVKLDTVKKVKKVKEKTAVTLEKKVEKEKPKKELKPEIYFAVGRRKTAVARVRLYTGLPKEENKMIVNDKPIEEYFPIEIDKKAYIEPFRTTNTIGRFKVTVKVEGSGKKGQLDACILGFARAIEQIDKAKFRPILKKRGLLTRDSRTRERRKVGTGGKARRQKQSPKR